MNIYKQKLLIDASIRGDTVAVGDLIRQPGVHGVWGDQKGLHAIHYAAMNGKNEVIETLIRRSDVWVDSHSGDNWTPLHFAVDHLKLFTIEFLVSKGANCNAQNMAGETPLHRAFFKLQSCEHKDDECPLRDRLNGCVTIPAIFHEQSKNLAEPCVLLSVAEFLIRKGKADLYIVNHHDSPTFYYTRYRYEDFHDVDRYFEMVHKAQRYCESAITNCKRLRAIKLFTCDHEFCGQCYMENEFKCPVCDKISGDK